MVRVRLQGDGWMPLVDEADGRYTYTFPVESGFANRSFSFPLDRRDVDVLLADPYRRAVMEVVTHAAFQRALGPDPVKLGEPDFRAVADATLHVSDTDLCAFLAAFDGEYRMGADHYVREAMARHAAKPRPVTQDGR